MWYNLLRNKNALYICKIFHFCCLEVLVHLKKHCKNIVLLHAFAKTPFCIFITLFVIRQIQLLESSKSL
jgi:hypothetical protein